MTTWYRRWVYGVLSLAFLAGLYAGFSHRDLNSEGSNFLFHMVANKAPFYYLGFYWRMFYLLPQLPSVALLRLSTGQDFSLALAIACYSISLAPLISLLCTWILLRRHGREEIFVFPVLSYFLATLSTQGFSGGLGNLPLTVFWPLLFLIYFQSESNWRSLFLIALGELALSCTYESSAAIFPFLALITFLKVQRARKAWPLYVSLCVSIGFSILTLGRFLDPEFRNRDSFGWSLRESLNPFVEIGFVNLLLFLVVLWSSRKDGPGRRLLSVGALVGIAGLSIVTLSSVFDHYNFWNYPSNARISSVPFGFLIAVFALTLAPFMKDLLLRKNLFATTLLATTFIFFYGIAFDVFVSYRSRVAIEEIRERLTQQPRACTQIDDDDFVNRISGEIGAHSVLPWTELLIQGTYKPTKIFFAPSEQKKNINFCERFTKGMILPQQHPMDFTTPSFFDFSILFSEQKAP